MFQQKDYQFFDLGKKEIKEYVIQPGDQFDIKIFSRDGFKLIDVLDEGTVAYGARMVRGYLVDREGFTKLPVLGEFYVKGYTETELERILAEKLSNLFVNPYVVVTVSNRRVFLFRGSSGSIIPLNQSPTNLLEVIAKAGGVAGNFKAYKIKIIRGDLKNPQIHVVDLSTLEGMRKADLIVQSNDIIYMEPKRNVVGALTAQLSPIFATSSTVFSLIALIKAWGGKF
ncbi:MAG: polysaccharide biosynthesis/export family protein [Bacteroidetes bacterium]|nr:polysaccharide biosynthesis/export family protein [Bacteroidota bacterium]